MTDFHELFDRATDGVESPGLAAVALRAARRRRVRRRGAAAVLASGLAVAAVVAGTQLGGGTSAGPPPSTSTPSSSDVVQTEWDPREAGELPRSGALVTPALPDVIDVPDSAPDHDRDPVGTAVLAAVRDDTIYLLRADGAWRSLTVPDVGPRVSLNPAGNRLAVYGYAEGAGATVYDLEMGESRFVPDPDDYEPYDGKSWTYVDDDTLLLDDYAGGFLVDRVGASERVAYPTGTAAIDNDGGVLEVPVSRRTDDLVDWAGGGAREVSMARTGRLSHVHADADTVVGKAQQDDGSLAVVVADRRTLTPRAVLPVANPDDNFGKGGMSVLALADDGTVLMRVADLGGATDGFRVVAWEPGIGALSLVSSVTGTDEVTFARSALTHVGTDVDIQEAWDPTLVADLPLAPDDVASVLPDVVDPPADAPLLADDPVAAVALGVQTGTDGTAFLLGTDRSWRRLTPPGEFPNVALSPDGTRVLVWAGVEAFPATLLDVATGESLSLPRPDGFQRSDMNSWTFVSDTELRIGGGRTPYSFDAVTGALEPAAQDAPGPPSVLKGYGVVPEVRLSSVAVNGDVLAGTTDDGGVAVVVADRDTLTPYAVLPVGARPDVFGAGKGLSVVDVTYDGTVLLRVNLVDLGKRGFDVVAWDPDTGAVGRVSRFPVPTYVSFAEAPIR